MSLVKTVREKLAELPAFAERRDVGIQAEGSPWTVSVSLERHDEIGCLVWELALRRPAPAKGDLGAWATAIADRVTGLLESLKVIEIDPERQEAQVRSEHPSQREDRLFYYEVVLRSTTEAVVRRFMGGSHGHKREQVAFALTHEALAKLVGDISAAAK